MTDGYPRFPTLAGDTIAFVAEDDLWSVPATGGTATRITSGQAASTHPAFSPDGTQLAYVGGEDGPQELFLISARGGRSQRLTFQGAAICWVGWEASGEYIRYASTVRAHNARRYNLWRIPVSGGEPEPLPVGKGLSIQTDDSGLTVISRGHPTRSAAYQKRYRGGTAGHLWIDADGSGEFTRMNAPNGFVEQPTLIDGRVFFLSDHEGTGNVYSYLPDGSDLRRHSDHEGYYARGLSGDGRRLTYHAGGTLYLLDPAEGSPRAVEVRIPAGHSQRSRKFVDAATYLHTSTLTPDGSRLTIETRGKLFTLGHWDGPVWQHGDADGTAYRLPTWLAGGERLVATSSDGDRAEVLVELSADGTTPVKRMTDLDIGRPIAMTASPTEAKIAVCNHKNELILVDLTGDSPQSTILDACRYGDIDDVVFSPDGRWLAYRQMIGSADGAEALGECELTLLNLETGHRQLAATRVLRDERPSFDPGGKYLYFIGHREFNPTYDSLDFDLSFVWGLRPYAVALRTDVEAPFLAEPTAPEPDKKDKADKDSPSLTIDLDGLADRVVPFPVSPNRYTRVYGIDGKVLLVSRPPKPSSSADIFNLGGDDNGVLESVDLATGKTETLAEGITDAWLSADRKTVLYRAGDRLRAIAAGAKAPDGDKAGRESGWIDLDRVKVSIRTDAEWPQMFAEAWRLQREHFWIDGMGGTDWDDVYRRYAPLSHRVTSRAEFSDLVWEMQGELGNSHAYEMFGDHRKGPQYKQGFLGAEYEVDADGDYTIAKILSGDTWAPSRTSPLNRPGVNVAIGDKLLAVNGQSVGNGVSPGERLANSADQEVWLTVRTGEAAPRTVKVKALANELPIRYRDWVEGNRRAVHEASDGRLGYLHVPDMGADGFAEFHRGFFQEHSRQGLVVDFRYNGGGHVSPLILDRLARPRTGLDITRYSQPYAYPSGSSRGPMVALTNENAGSDGDLGTHHFKSRGLGPVIGKRTWGGTVGINPRHRLADNTVVTQPEYSMHMDDVGWGIENYGVDPDIEVEYAPQDYAAGRDPQLERAIAEALTLVEKHPVREPRIEPLPRLAAPPLPPRG